MPSAFITYRRADDARNDRVQSLAKRLRKNGIEVFFDQFHEVESGETKIDWRAWTSEYINRADKILIIGSKDCFETFTETAEPDPERITIHAVDRIYEMKERAPHRFQDVRIVYSDPDELNYVTPWLESRRQYHENDDFAELVSWIKGTDVRTPKEPGMLTAAIGGDLIEREDYRIVVQDACDAARVRPVFTGRIRSGSSPDTREALDIVDDADIFIGVFVPRPRGEGPFREVDFERAMARKRAGALRDILVFHPEEISITGGRKDGFISPIRADVVSPAGKTDFLTWHFRSLGDLREIVTAALLHALSGGDEPLPRTPEVILFRDGLDFPWSSELVDIIHLLRERHRAAARSLRESRIAMKGFRAELTPRALFLTAMIHAAEKAAGSDSESPDDVFGNLLSTGVTPDWRNFNALLTEEFFRGGEPSPARDEPMESEIDPSLHDLAERCKALVEVVAGDQGLIRGHHLLAAMLEPGESDLLAGSMILRRGDVIHAGQAFWVLANVVYQEIAPQERAGEWQKVLSELATWIDWNNESLETFEAVRELLTNPPTGLAIRREPVKREKLDPEHLFRMRRAARDGISPVETRDLTLTPEDAARVRDFLRSVEGFTPSACCWKIGHNAWEDCAGLHEAKSSPTVTASSIYIAFIEVGLAEQPLVKSGDIEISLPASYVEQLGLTADDLDELRSVEVARMVPHYPQPSGVEAGETAVILWREAARIAGKCRREGSWIAARHLLAAFLSLNSSPAGRRIHEELKRLGFDPEKAGDILIEHLSSQDEDHDTPWQSVLESAGCDKDSTAVALGKGLGPSRYNALCLDIDRTAESIATIFLSGRRPRENSDQESRTTDFIFALYGEWGRGKSTLMKKVSELLQDHKEIPRLTAQLNSQTGDDTGDTKKDETELKRPGSVSVFFHGHPEPHPSYAVVDFSAWRFPSRPEVWVHLYERIREAAENHSWLQRLRLSFRCGLLESGWWPLVSGVLLLVVARLALGEWMHHIWSIAGWVGALLILGFLFRAWKIGYVVTRGYLKVPEYADKLGLQAVVGRDLKRLLQLWITPASEKADPDLDWVDFRPGKLGSWMRLAVRLLVIVSAVAACWSIDKAHSGKMAAYQQAKSAEDARTKAEQEARLQTEKEADDRRQLEEELARRAAMLEILPSIDFNGAPQRWRIPEKLPAPHSEAQLLPSPWPGTANWSPVLPLIHSFEEQQARARELAMHLQQARDLALRIRQVDLSALKQVAAQIPASLLPVMPPAVKPSHPWAGYAVVVTLSLIFLLYLRVASRPLERFQTLLLTVDDLDRCDDKQMLAVIECLRLFVDDPAMSGRLQMAMLMDLDLLHEALDRRARSSPLAKGKEEGRWYRRTHREKIFLCEFALPELQEDHREQLLDSLFPLQDEEEPHEPGTMARDEPDSGRSSEPSKNPEELVRNLAGITREVAETTQELFAQVRGADRHGKELETSARDEAELFRQVKEETRELLAQIPRRSEVSSEMVGDTPRAIVPGMGEEKADAMPSPAHVSPPMPGSEDIKTARNLEARALRRVLSQVPGSHFTPRSLLMIKIRFELVRLLIHQQEPGTSLKDSIVSGIAAHLIKSILPEAKVDAIRLPENLERIVRQVTCDR
ncbi:P-loop NTPase fold protein [Luteolibacter flavescens]|uniref:P-loop NTPase fold protein n=1 Tax=Luteolibacter flavescens TaxID=1859460 RepID=A0ABT3FHR0_9BACT|nr:P-loop NTPase fold protein [Luteolibacter flavescens]MCW1883095.1 P-loop NTPase fold protein [Luteolibacter flavescens]